MSQTKRRYAHELYPHAEEGEVRPLAVEVPYLYARMVGLRTNGTSWYDLRHTPLELEYSTARIIELIEARRTALLADALLQGLGGHDAWDWAEARACDESGEIAGDRAAHYGIPFEQIKPYPCGPEPDHHDHLDEPDRRGWRTVHRVTGKESECPDCCEAE